MVILIFIMCLHCRFRYVVMQAPMIAAGVIDAVVTILKANIDHSGIQGNGIGCLANLACHNEAIKVWTVVVWVVITPGVF